MKIECDNCNNEIEIPDHYIVHESFPGMINMDIALSTKDFYCEKCGIQVY
jgi:hypothetical protein